MKEILKKNKKKLTAALIIILFSAYIINGIREYSIIPDHIHSIDDKAPEERTNEDNIIIIERSLQKDPGNVKLMFELSGLYMKAGDEETARNLLTKIIEIDPYHKEAGEILNQMD